MCVKQLSQSSDHDQLISQGVHSTTRKQLVSHHPLPACREGLVGSKVIEDTNYRTASGYIVLRLGPLTPVALLDGMCVMVRDSVCVCVCAGTVYVR